MRNANKTANRDKSQIFFTKVLPSLIQITCLMVVLYTLAQGIVRFCKKDTRALTKEKIACDETYIAFTLCPTYRLAGSFKKKQPRRLAGS